MLDSIQRGKVCFEVLVEIIAWFLGLPAMNNVLLVSCCSSRYGLRDVSANPKVASGLRCALLGWAAGVSLISLLTVNVPVSEHGCCTVVGRSSRWLEFAGRTRASAACEGG